MDWNKYKPYMNKHGRLISEVPIEIYVQLREDALKASGLWGHPKADIFYGQAWKSYEFGLEEVFATLDAIAEMEFYTVDTPGASKADH